MWMRSSGGNSNNSIGWSCLNSLDKAFNTMMIDEQWQTANRSIMHHHHHQLFWKNSFLQWWDRIETFAHMKFLHISLKNAHSGRKPLHVISHTFSPRIFSLTYITTIHSTSFLIPQSMYLYRFIFLSFWTHPAVFDLVHPILHLYFILANWQSLLDPSAALKNLPPFTIIWLIIPQTFSHSTKPGCNLPILTTSSPHRHPLAYPSWTLHILMVMVVVLLSFTDHSSKSNHSVLEIFLLLYLLNSWQLNLLLVTKKLSFLTH